jgi:hypothetical protein
MFDNTALIKYKFELSNLSRAFKKGCSEEHWRKKERDLYRMPTPDDIIMYENSEIRRTVKNKLRSLKQFTELDKSEYCLIKGYLCSEILLDNASRGGVIG